jgi:hypothetical protein
MKDVRNSTTFEGTTAVLDRALDFAPAVLNPAHIGDIEGALGTVSMQALFHADHLVGDPRSFTTILTINRSCGGSERRVERQLRRASRRRRGELGSVPPIAHVNERADRRARRLAVGLVLTGLVELAIALLSAARLGFSGTPSRFGAKVGKRLSESFGEVVARSSSDYRADGSLADFVVKPDKDMRVAFAQSVGWWLHQMAEAYAEGVWQSWVLDYLDDRLGGKSLPFAPAEAAGVLRWITAAGEHFPTAVERYLETPASFAELSIFFKDLDGASLPERYPVATAWLLAFVVSRSQVFYTCDMVGGLVDSLRQPLTADRRHLLLDICESSLALGCGDAVAGKAVIDARWPANGMPSTGPKKSGVREGPWDALDPTPGSPT